MANNEHKEKIDKFCTQIKKLGGKQPIAEWSTRSGLIGFEYNGQILRWQVPGTAIREEMLERMITACTAALSELQCQRIGIRRIG